MSLTLKEFRCWLEGFEEAFSSAYGNAPNKEQWAKIKDKLAEVDVAPTPVFPPMPLSDAEINKAMEDAMRQPERIYGGAANINLHSYRCLNCRSEPMPCDGCKDIEWKSRARAAGAVIAHDQAETEKPA